MNMKMLTQGLLVALLVALAVSVSAAPTVILRDTVIPVKLDTPLSSVTSRVGDAFTAQQEGAPVGGFPEYTYFTGKVRSVTRASGTTAGQIGVGFVSAHLPDGTTALMTGRLTSLDEDSVKTDPATGRLIGTSSSRNSNLKFIAIGAGAGLLIGQLTDKNKVLYAVLGSAAGYLYGQKHDEPAVGKDVEVLAGSSFGILMDQDVALVDSAPAAVAGVTAVGNASYARHQVTFNNLRPFMVGDDLMVPFRSAMNSIDMPFDFDAQTKTIRVNVENSQSMHTIGSRSVYVDGAATRFAVASRIVNGSLYVPASYLELMTGRTAYWDQDSGVLRLE